MEGELYVLNTMEGFKLFDRKAAVQKVRLTLCFCYLIWIQSVEMTMEAIENGRLYNRESAVLLLQRFVLVTYADLKNREYMYWRES